MKKLLMLLAGMMVIPAAEAAYRCTDEKGRTHVGDTPPPQCEKVPMYEVSKSGLVIRKIDPTPTEDEKRALIEEAARQKELARQADEQRRKDLALLATYSAEKDFDISRDRNIDPVQSRIKSAQERLKAVEKREKELEDEMEFYKAGKSKAAGKTREAPTQLVTDLDRAKKEKVQLASSLVSYDKEIEQIRSRYDTDKKRWVELKQLHREGKLDLRDPREIEAARKNAPVTGQPVKKYNLYLVPAN